MDSDKLSELDQRFNRLLEEIQEVAEQRRSLRKMDKRKILHPILTEKERRAMEFYRTQQRALWTPHEMKFGEDIEEYQALSEDMKRLIDIPFAFFAGADGSVIDMLAIRFLLEPETYHEMCFYLAQLYIESVHAETYALLITHLIPDDKKAERLLSSHQNDPVIKSIHDWIDGFLTGTYSDVERKAGVALMEGAIFQAPFLFIFYFKTLGTMKNIRFANEQISKDEALHADKGCDFVKHWRSENGKAYDESIYKLAEEARKLVRAFSMYVLTRDSPDGDKEGGKEGKKGEKEKGKVISVPQLEEAAVMAYCDLVVNNILYKFGLEQVYEVDRSLIPSWMHSIADVNKSNFYEYQVSNYSQYSHKDIDDGEGESDSDVDF